MHQSACLKAHTHTAQDWWDCFLERFAHLANDVGAHWGCPAGALLFLPQPPPSSGVRPQPYKEIARLIGQPQLPAGSIRTIVRRFHLARQVRGRKKGWRKTTAAEDARIFACFQKVRRPLGSLVESQDVWKALPATLRDKERHGWR